jgi:Zn-dependent protease with chaperone function
MSELVEPEAAAPEAIYLDGRVNRKRRVRLNFGPALEIYEDGALLAAWPYADVRRRDGAPDGLLSIRAVGAPELARLETRDAALMEQITAHCRLLEGDRREKPHSMLKIVGWSLAATASILGLIWFGVPLAADRIAPLIPLAWEKRFGEAVEKQALDMFSGKECKAPKGLAALEKFSARLQAAATLRLPASIHAIASKVPNAFALPGGKVFLLDGLLEKAQSQDEMLGVLAHELGHVENRDHLRRIVADGGTAYLVGLLFGDVTGGGALIFASKTLLSAANSRDAEAAADAFAAKTLAKLGRPAKPMGELLLRVTGKEADGFFTILHDHPLSEDRLAKLAAADEGRDKDKGAVKAPVLTDEEWKALKAICE